MVFNIYSQQICKFEGFISFFFSSLSEDSFTCKASTCLEIKHPRHPQSVVCWFGVFSLLWIAGVTNCWPYLSQLLSVWLTLCSCVKMFAATEWNQLIFLPWRFWRKLRERTVSLVSCWLCVELITAFWI